MNPTQSIIKALFEANKELAIKKSLMHCHVRGLHSVVLSEGVDGKLIRMFVATQTHLMTGADSLAFHTHHCDITLVPVVGEFTNLVLTEGSRSSKNKRFKKFRFQSPLKTGSKESGSFKSLNSDAWCGVVPTTFHAEGPSVTLKASEFHSVSVPPNTAAAWLVVEGEEDPERPDYVLSNERLQDWTAENFYKPFDTPTLGELVAFVTSYEE